PPDGSVTLEDGLCIGVPKRVLAAAFVAACSIFFENRDEPNESSVLAALDATRVILLFDPEHLTAANFRRLQLEESVSGLKSDSTNSRRLHLELNFLDSILTSPLHRQSKSPTLWSYRSWIINAFDLWSCIARRNARDGGWEALSADFTRELGVVLKSAERHPKNYYAWQYARRLIRQSTESRGDVDPSMPPVSEILVLSTRTTHDWCIRNPSDTSAWSFLYFLLRRLHETEHKFQEATSRTLELARSFHWKHEAVWVFLRTVIADSELTSKQERAKYLQEMESEFGMNGSLPPTSEATSIRTPHPALEAMVWIRRNTKT
ncbi:hypothetical protein B0J12DRAFT_767087, partial [Macrophomina phaseolina]